MADDSAVQDAPKRKKGLLIPLLMGLVLAIAGGAGGFWAVTSGPLAPDPPSEIAVDTAPTESPMPPVAVSFVPLETLVISLGPEETSRHLLFTAELEVDPAHAAEVAHLSPRVLDVLNSYLRVISVAELSDPASLARLRAQMLRRIQIVTGTGRVHDLLVTQFVVN
ncbi:flagellar basal body-associated FliL family protein [Roseicyclus mahoneyensis]|uniref:Flagellar protein FliL n=1 Tax=Roseicyclus mahoneyensis TaxID=164332 RepID=A0A316GII6_9RHOB|nr:flagellar basal body-associated FliL family protein [Roseicyclus mahoneyensis]PWK59812.1 flagellar FliL protein [Roseicyclus mahoneyensis]